MAKLIMNPHAPSRRDIPLPRTILSIGRDPSNDLVLPDAMVSRRHAVIECRGNSFFLRDCNSSNGSLVNGDRVSERSLRDGDLVAIGAARLLFREELELGDSGGKVVQHPSAPRLQCPGCHADFRKGDAFCRQCGARLQEGPAKVVCVSCGTAVPLPARFCNACGGRLGPEGTPGDPPADTDERPRDELAPPDPSAEAPAAEAAAGLGPAAAPAATVEPGAAVPQADGVPGDAPAVAPAASGGHVDAEVAPSASRSSVVPQAREPEPARERALPAAEPPRERGRVGLSGERPRVVHISSRTGEPGRSAPAPAPAATPGGAGPRIAATLVDALIVGAAQAVLLLPLALVPARAPAGPSAGEIALVAGLGALALLLAVAYALYFWGQRGATPGERLLGLRVESADGARPIGLRLAAVRLLGFALSAGALGLGFLPVLTGGEALHDRLSRTRVVRGR